MDLRSHYSRKLRIKMIIDKKLVLLNLKVNHLNWLERYLFQIIIVKYPAIIPFIIAPISMAMYNVGTMGITFSRVVKYIEVIPVIPVATVRRTINVFDLIMFPSWTLNRLKRPSISTP